MYKCTNVPNRLVESLEFRELLQAADPWYPVPGRTALNKELDLVMKELKGKIALFSQAMGVTC